MDLVEPSAEYLPSYADALRRGWSPDNLRPAVAQEQLATIESDPFGFLAEQIDRDAMGRWVVLPDGVRVPRLPSVIRWMWDGDFSGAINFRWQPNTAELPPYCLGHIGFAVVPWKRGRGYATQALHEILPYAKELGLPYVELTTDADNFASQHVITANGGTLFEEFNKPASYGGAPSLRFRIRLDKPAA
jgi:predicted acetyltransferase